MEEGLAAAFGAGVLPTDKRASAIVDIGAGTTNIAIVAKGAVVHSTSERYGSNAINEVLATHLRRHRGLQVGEETTEMLEDDILPRPILPEDISKIDRGPRPRRADRQPGGRRDHDRRGLSDRRKHRPPHRRSCKGHADRAAARGRGRHLRSRRHPDRRRSTARRHRPIHAFFHQSRPSPSPTSRVTRPSTASSKCSTTRNSSNASPATNSASSKTPRSPSKPK